LELILASTRPGRVGEKVAGWFHERAAERRDLSAELVDLRDWQLPYYDMPAPPYTGDYADWARPWAEVVGRADGFVIITPEYNHGYPAILKSALDAIYLEWNRKPVGFVSYGGMGAGVRAAQQLRQVVIELQMVPIRPFVAIRAAQRTFDDDGRMISTDVYNPAAVRLLDEVVWWANLLRAAR
jgi:NAD(P)H-dependent FMN reductase